MAFHEKDLRSRGQKLKKGSLSKSFSRIINENNKKYNSYDIFLSHRKLDAELILGIKDKLEDKYGYTVYIDWVDDPQLNRDDVNKETANVLRVKMQQSKSLIYVYSKKSTESKWMPWELGYMDGAKENKCTVLSIVPSFSSIVPNYEDQEYLSIYPPLKEDFDIIMNNKQLFVYEDSGRISFKEWLNRNSNKQGSNKNILYG